MDGAKWVTAIDQAAPWAAMEGLGAALTAVFALLVFLEARKIRRAEWTSAMVEKWQDFNRFLIETDTCERWEKLRRGEMAPDEMTAADRYLFMQFFNIQQAEFAAAANRLLHPAVREAMAADIALMRAIAPYIETLSRDAGHDARFRKFLRASLAGKNSARRAA